MRSLIGWKRKQVPATPARQEPNISSAKINLPIPPEGHLQRVQKSGPAFHGQPEQSVDLRAALPPEPALQTPLPEIPTEPQPQMQAQPRLRAEPQMHQTRMRAQELLELDAARAQELADQAALIEQLRAEASAAEEERQAAHLALRTVRKQGASQGNVKPLGPIAQETSKKLFSKSASRKADPAPSRTRYRMERLWLSPLFRVVLKKGAPILGLFAIAIYLLSDPNLRQEVSQKLADARESIEERPEFRVDLIKVTGTASELIDRVREATELRLPVTTFDLDLEKLRTRVESMDEVAQASLYLRTGGILNIDIKPREPVAIWRVGKNLTLLDAQGVKSGQLEARVARRDLPLVSGQGADAAIAEALAIHRAAGPVKKNLYAVARIGDRRWDLVLDRGLLVKLPVENPIQAVERLIALNEAQDLLARDIRGVDLRDPRRPILRLSEQALDKLRPAEVFDTGEDTSL